MREDNEKEEKKKKKIGERESLNLNFTKGARSNKPSIIEKDVITTNTIRKK